MDFPRRVFLCAWLLASGAAQALPALQALLDAAPAGATLRLAPGDYAGPAVLRKPLTLDGAGRARLRGDGRGTVLRIETSGASVRGLALDGSGDTHDGIDAGILVAGDDNVIEANTLEDVLFGIHLKSGKRNRIVGNRVVGKDLPLGQRGDALRLWNSRHNRIENNRFHDGRQAMHVIFSPRLLIADNLLENTGTGIVAMYSRK